MQSMDTFSNQFINDVKMMEAEKGKYFNLIQIVAHVM